MPKKVMIEEVGGSYEQNDRNVFLNKTKTETSLRQFRSIIEGYIQEIVRAQRYNEDEPTARQNIYETMEALLAQERQIGSSTDFHNLAVALGGNGFDALACDVLELGLKRYPCNVDLLADYLIYGIDCERFEECKEVQKTLSAIPYEDWTWRCFAFQISYFKRQVKDFASSLEERTAYKKIIADLSKKYKKYLPYAEGGYLETAKLQEKNPEMELRLLEDALNSEKLGACSSCALETAEILFRQKKYKEALEAIDRSLEDSINEKQGTVKDFDLYFMRGLCKNALLVRAEEEIGQDQVYSIYDDFNVALGGVERDYRDRIKDRVRILERGTKIKIPEDCEELWNLMD